MKCDAICIRDRMAKKWSSIHSYFLLWISDIIPDEIDNVTSTEVSDIKRDAELREILKST